MPEITLDGGAALLVEDNSVARPLVERFRTMLAQLAQAVRLARGTA